MDDNIVEALRAEAARLQDKLAAIEAVIRVYGSPALVVSQRPTATAAANSIAPRASADGLGQVGLMGSGYAREVRTAAKQIITDAPTRPVPTRIIVKGIKERGIVIRGQRELNAISALLSRSDYFKNVDRMGWVLADDENYRAYPGNENGEATAEPDDRDEGASDPLAPDFQPLTDRQERQVPA